MRWGKGPVRLPSSHDNNFPAFGSSLIILSRSSLHSLHSLRDGRDRMKVSEEEPDRGVTQDEDDHKGNSQGPEVR